MTPTRETLVHEMEMESDAEMDGPQRNSRLLSEFDVSLGDQTVDRPYLVGKLLWERRRSITSFVVWGTLLFLAIAFLLPNTYESKSELMPPDPQSSAMGTLAALTGGAGGAGGVLSSAADLLGVRTSGALFIDILRSHTIEDRLINRFDLRRVYRTKTYLKARKKLESRTSISEEKKSGVLTIVVSDHDPQRAAALVQAYIVELNHMVADLNTSAAHRERVFLEQRLQVVKEELDRSAKDFSDFSSKNAAIDIKEQGRSMVAAAATVQGQIIAAESEMRGLEQLYSVNNVRVRAVQARLKELQDQLQKLGGSSSTPEMAENSYPSLRQLPVLGLTYADLYRRLTINESVYEALTREYELARVQEAKEVPSIKVIDPAELPERRTGPPRALITASGALLSLCVAGIWLFSNEAWANTDDRNPRKILAGEILLVVHNTVRWNRAREISLKMDPFRFRRRFYSHPEQRS
ncbi:MAG TPA: Wzz/FepE/Etk N-terminal domain-containing protein [Terriglobales bacterium]|nr:Wzz/FepE/Etk N-terminal domain-containing protein [Terriglobales bacterium]